MRNYGRIATCLIAFAGWAGASDPDDDLTSDDLLEMSIDDLLEVDVISVSRTKQRLTDTSAAVSVLSANDLRRTGHTSLAEALRLVPGFHVARLNASTWSIGARGFTGRFADKLLVLVDGRSVYTPSFAGVHWLTQDTFLPDLDRIEVVRGPGASAWGANAVNGVVNVRTKSARDTQGGLVEAAGGSREHGLFGARYGGVLAEEEAWYRVFVRGRLHDDGDDPSGAAPNDAWHQVRGGFRIDWHADESTQWMISGEAYGGRAGQRALIPTLTAPFGRELRNDPDTNGGHILARWTQRGNDGVETEVQMYLTREEVTVGDLREERTTFDVDLQHRLAPIGRHDILAGLNFRLTSDRFRNGFVFSLDPSGRTDPLVGAFLQDTITWHEGTLVLTIGTKLEHNDYSGLEVQPTARLRWSPAKHTTTWISISRAVRSPSRADHDLRLNAAAFDNGGTTTLLAFLGNDQFDSEELLAFEWGLRWNGWGRFSVDVTAFFNVYDQLRGFTALPPTAEAEPAPPHGLAASLFDNVVEGDVYGVELSAVAQIHERVRILANYSFSRTALDNSGSVVPIDPEGTERRFPRHLASVRIQVDLARGWDFDAIAYYSDSTPTTGVGSYVRVDLRLGYQPSERLGLDLIVRNLGHDGEIESTEELSFLQSTEIATSVLFRVTYRW